MLIHRNISIIKTLLLVGFFTLLGQIANAQCSATIGIGATSSLNVCEGVSIQFLEVVNTGFSQSRTWDFGDGTANSNASNPTHTFPPGVLGDTAYTITLTVNCLSGQNSISTTTVNIFKKPQVSFTANKTTVCALSDSVCFSNTSDNAAGYTYNWNFGATAFQPCNVYATPGTFAVRLVVTTDKGCTNELTIPDSIHVKAAPSPDFIVDNFIDCHPMTVNFTNTTDTTLVSISAWSWNFGNGNTSSSETPTTQIYALPDTFFISLQATDALGCFNSTTQAIIAKQTPTSAFTTTPFVCVKDSATITYTGSFAAAGTPTYNWNFDNGNTASGLGIGPHKVEWDSSGIKQISLTITDNGCSSSSTNSLFVNPTPIGFLTTSAVGDSICDGSAISLIVQPTNYSSYQFFVNGGMVQNSTSNTYSATNFVNSDSVTVQFTDLNGCFNKSADTSLITVIPIPVVTLSSNIPNDTICAYDTVIFTVNPVGLDNYQFDENFADVQNGNLNTYKYTRPSQGGVISVKGTKNGCKSTASNAITIAIIDSLPTPVVNCGISTNTSIQFIWNNIVGATGYEVSINGGVFMPPSTGNLGLSHTLTGLSVNDIDSINVRVLGGPPCGNGNTSNTLVCSAIPCVAVTYTQITDTIVCENDAVNLFISNVSTTNFSVSWNGGLFQSLLTNNFTVTKDTVVSVTVLDSTQLACPATSSFINITLNKRKQINVSASVNNDTICQGDVLIFETLPDNISNYQFFRNGVQLLQNGPNPEYITTLWQNGDSMKVVAVKDGCFSSSFVTLGTTVLAPLATPQINCGVTTNSTIALIWDSIAGATNYEISIDGNPFTPINGGNGLSHDIIGLTPGTPITALLKAIGNAPCGNSNTSLPITCFAQQCTPISFNIAPTLALCVGDSAHLIASNISATNYDLMWNGISSGTNPKLDFLPTSDTLIVVSLLDLNQVVCPMNVQFVSINVNFIPSVTVTSSSVSNAICENANITFTTAPAGLDNYQFVNGFATLQNGQNQIYNTNNWQSGDSLVVIATNKGCVGSSSGLAITTTVVPPLATPQVNCGNSTNSSIQFAWDSIPNATGYEVSINGSAFVTPNSGNLGLTQDSLSLVSGTPLTISVRALGIAPCGNSAASTSQTCRAIVCTAVTFDKGSDLVLCEGATVNLSISNLSPTNYSVQWGSNPISQDTIISFIAVVDTFVSVTVTDVNQAFCPMPSKTFTVTVNPLPVVNLTSSPLSDSICASNAITFTATPTNYDIYTFFNKFNTLQTSANPNYITSNIQNGDSITVIATNNGCVNPSTDTITKLVFDLLPTPVVNCGVSDNTSLRFIWDSIPNATGYQISIDGGTFVTPSSGNFGLNESLTGLTLGSSFTAQIITLGNPPCGNSMLSNVQTCSAIVCNTNSFITSNDLNLCDGQTANLSISNLNPTSNYGVIWGSATATTNTNISFIPTVDTIVSVAFIDSSQLACPTITKNIKIIVNPLPTVTLSTTTGDSICQSETVVFNASPTNFDSYSFINGFDTVQNSSNFNYTTLNLQNGNILTVVATNNGCQGNASTQAISKVVIDSLVTPQINCGSSDNTQVNFIWDSIPNATGYLVSVDGGAFINPSASLLHNFATVTSATIQVMALGKNPCGNSATSAPLSCAAIPCNSVTFTKSNNPTVCIGAAVNLRITNLNVSSNYSIVWGNNVAILDSNFSFIPTVDTTVSVTLIDSSQLACSTPTKVFSISVNPLPVVNLSSSVGDSICASSSVTFTASPASYDTYLFYNKFSLLQSSANPNYSTAALQNGDSITVIAINSGCTNASIDTITKIVFDSLATPVINCGASDNTSLSFVWDSVSNAMGYLISINGAPFVNPSSGNLALTESLSNLIPGTNITAQVIALGNPPCGNSLTSSIATCSAINCNVNSFIVSNDLSLCAGQTANLSISNLNPSTNFSVIWGSTAATTTTSISLVPTADTTISVALIDTSQLACPTVTKFINVKVKPIPVVNLSTLTGDSICQSETIIFNAIPNNFNSYAFFNGFQVVQNGSNPNYTTNNLQNGDVITVVPTDNGCLGNPSTQVISKVVIDSLTTPFVNCGNSSNTTVNFTWDSVITTTSYLVSVNGGSFVVPSSGNLGLLHNISGMALGDSATIQVMALGSAPCGNSLISISKTCKAIPCTSVNFTKIADATICQGIAINLKINNLSISSNFGILWGNNPASVNTNFVLTPPNDTIISITLIDSTQLQCPMPTKQITITVNPLPMVALSSNTNDTICVNQAITFTASPASYNSYAFFNGFQVLQNGSNPVFISNNFQNGDSITVVATDLGCVGVASTQKITKTVIDSIVTPQVNCGTSTNTSVQFVWDAVANASSYLISVNNTAFVPPTTGSLNLFENSTGLVLNDAVTIQVMAVSNTPCGNSSVSQLLTCTAIPCNTILVNTPTDTSLCLGDTLFATINGLSNTTFGVKWNSEPFSKDTSKQIIAQNDTLFTIEIIDSLQLACPSVTKQFSIIVNSIPVVNLSSSLTNDSVCSNQSFSFTASPSGFDNYNFVNGFLSLQNSANQNINITNWNNGDSLMVVPTDKGCVGLPSVAVLVNVTDSANTPFVNCGVSTISSVQFLWDAVANTTDYTISVNGAVATLPSSGANGLVHNITGLAMGDTVSINVTALGNNPCGKSITSQTTTCFAIACNLVNFDKTADTTICAGQPTTISLSNLTTASYGISYNGNNFTTAISQNFIATNDTSFSIQMIDSTQLACPSITKQINIKVNPIPVFTLTSSTTNDSLCASSKINFTATPAGFDNYQFFDGVTLIQDSTYQIYQTNNLSGTNAITVVVTNKGCSATSSNSIATTIIPLPIVTLSSPTTDTICGNDLLLFTANPSGLVSYEFFEQGISVQNSTQNIFSTFSLNSADSVYVKATNFFGCKSLPSNSITTFVFAIPQISLTTSDADSTICFRENIAFTVLPAGMTNYQFLINDTLAVSDTNNLYSNDSIVVGSFIRAIATDANGCSSDTTAAIAITVLPISAPFITVSDSINICLGDTVQISVNDTNFTNTPFVWSTTETTNTISVSPTSSTTYLVIGVLNGCNSLADSILILVDNTNPVAIIGAVSGFVCVGDSIQMQGTGGANFMWTNNVTTDTSFIQNPYLASPFVVWDTSGVIIITLEVKNTACTSAVSLAVETNRCLDNVTTQIPQVITPNGDGANDTWRVPDIDFFTQSRVVIFNRWEDIVFESSPYLNDWGGTNQSGANLPDGTYFYALDLGNGKPPITGFILIHR